MKSHRSNNWTNSSLTLGRFKKWGNLTSTCQAGSPSWLSPWKSHRVPNLLTPRIMRSLCLQSQHSRVSAARSSCCPIGKLTQPTRSFFKITNSGLCVCHTGPDNSDHFRCAIPSTLRKTITLSTSKEEEKQGQLNRNTPTSATYQHDMDVGKPKVTCLGYWRGSGGPLPRTSPCVCRAPSEEQGAVSQVHLSDILLKMHIVHLSCNDDTRVRETPVNVISKYVLWTHGSYTKLYNPPDLWVLLCGTVTTT